jgi:hypothetical protein
MTVEVMQLLNGTPNKLGGQGNIKAALCILSWT